MKDTSNLTRKKIVVFGAAGRTGLYVIRQAAKQGFVVTAFVRNGTILPPDFPATNTIEGDVFKLEDVERAVRGQDAVISVLGTTANSSLPVVSQGTSNIAQAMDKFHVRRLIVQSAHGAGTSSKEVFLPVRLIMREWLLKNPFYDKDDMERSLMQSDLEWTIVRPTRLSKKDEITTYRTGEHIHLGLSPSVPRAAVADFLLKLVNTEEYIRQKPTITT